MAPCYIFSPYENDVGGESDTGEHVQPTMIDITINVLST